MIISISGRPGSGKDTAAVAIAKTLGYKHYSMGGIRRQMARERGITLEEFNMLGETEDFTDRTVDDYQKKLGETEDNFVIDGRTMFFFIPQSFKVFLDCSIEEGARRIWRQLQKDGQAPRNEDDHVNSLADMIASLQKRVASDARRYQKYYGIDVYEPKNYDLVIDTTHLSPAEVNQRLLEEVTKHVVAAN